MERTPTTDYPILKFYCDWAVHTQKDHVTREMKEIVSNMYDDIVYEIHKGWPPQRRKVTSFMYMEELKLELKKFLEGFGLPTKLTEKSNWVEFVSTFVNVLSDQPIISPTENIESINILPTTRGVVICRIIFSEPIKEFKYYDYKNAF
jgi:hypothetical protein